MTLNLNPLEALPCVTIEQLDIISERNLFNDKAISLSNSQSKKFIDYYNSERRNRYGYIGILPAEYTYEYHQIKNEWQRKIVTVEVDEDLVIVVLKHVQMFKYIYKRLEGLPISISNNRKNEEKVFDKLSSSGLVLKFLSNEPESKWLEEKGYTVDTIFETYNYYSNVNVNFAKIGSNKWRTKKGVNRLLKDCRLSFKKLTKQDKSVDKINEAFIRWKKDVEKSKWLSKGFSDSISKYPYWNDNNVEYYLFEYDDFPIGLIVYLIVNGDIGYQLVNKGIDHMVFDEPIEIPDEIRKRIGAYMHYVTMKDLYDRKVTDTFAGGAMGIRKASLGIYKKIMNDSYFGVKIYGSHT